ncbi:MAG: hypothetical protein LBF25_00220 [Puniceicoccales bacterium]|jgi:hypothetical protein|nr:hypothetical protein [Puniceicoccales bacterium]
MNCGKVSGMANQCNEIDEGSHGESESDEDILSCFLVYGAPSIDPEEVQRSWKDYTDRALEPVLEWVQNARPAKGNVFQYGEVLEKLKEYEPPIRYGITFAKKTLLPEIFKRDLSHVPLDLIAILYTLSVPCRECRFLSAVLDSTLGSVGDNDLFLKFMYENSGKVWSYRVRNFKNPEIAKIEVVW